MNSGTKTRITGIDQSDSVYYKQFILNEIKSNKHTDNRRLQRHCQTFEYIVRGCPRKIFLRHLRSCADVDPIFRHRFMTRSSKTK